MQRATRRAATRATPPGAIDAGGGCSVGGRGSSSASLVVALVACALAVRRRRFANARDALARVSRSTLQETEMTTSLEPKKMKLLVVVASFEMRDSLARDLEAHGAHGYTVTKVDGHGEHGPRRYGILDGANVRIESLLTGEVTQRILMHIADHYPDRELIAYALDAETYGHRFAPAGKTA
jgi:MYXO-CTERM domain-containing protein